MDRYLEPFIIAFLSIYLLVLAIKWLRYAFGYEKLKEGLIFMTIFFIMILGALTQTT